MRHLKPESIKRNYCNEQGKEQVESLMPSQFLTGIFSEFPTIPQKNPKAKHTRKKVRIIIGEPMQCKESKNNPTIIHGRMEANFFGMGNSFLSSRHYWCICTQKAMKDSGMRRTLPTSRVISTFVFFSCGFARQ